MLHKRHAEADASSAWRRLGVMPEVARELLRRQAQQVPALLLHLRPGAAQDPLPGQRPREHPGGLREALRRHQPRAVRQGRQEENHEDPRRRWLRRRERRHGDAGDGCRKHRGLAPRLGVRDATVGPQGVPECRHHVPTDLERPDAVRVWESDHRAGVPARHSAGLDRGLPERAHSHGCQQRQESHGRGQSQVCPDVERFGRALSHRSWFEDEPDQVRDPGHRARAPEGFVPGRVEDGQAGFGQGPE
mmetsp:Transcript_78732/g.197823  ORF Transcript_78732/g.197823 Transcript_78732/m.197823 type:complete len:247 (+) Transcript_78732:1955-2695(+)